MYEFILVNLYTKTIGGRKRGGIWFPKLYSQQPNRLRLRESTF